jgi:hypothetical protein
MLYTYFTNFFLLELCWRRHPIHSPWSSCEGKINFSQCCGTRATYTVALQLLVKNLLLGKYNCFFFVFFLNCFLLKQRRLTCWDLIYDKQSYCISWPHSETVGGAGFEPSVWCRPVALTNWATTSPSTIVLDIRPVSLISGIWPDAGFVFQDICTVWYRIHLPWRPPGQFYHNHTGAVFI